MRASLVRRSLLVIAGAFVGTAVTYAAVKPPITVRRPSARPLPAPVSATLYRMDIQPGKEALFEEWMSYLREHKVEGIATFERERVYLEAVFTVPDEPRRVYWLEFQAAGGESSATSPFEVDRRHRAYMAATIIKSSHIAMTTRDFGIPPFLVEAIREHQIRSARTKS